MLNRHYHQQHPLSPSTYPSSRSQSYRHHNLALSDPATTGSQHQQQHPQQQQQQQQLFFPQQYQEGILDPTQQPGFHSPSTTSSSQPFAAVPLTPAQSQRSNLPYLSTPPSSSAAASPTYSSPAFSTQNSPSTELDSSFWPETASFSMQDNTYSSLGGLPHTPPIKVFQPAPLFGDDGFDQQDVAGASMLLQSGLPLDNTEFNNLLSPVKFCQNSRHSQQQQFYPGISHKRASSGSSVLSLPSASAVPPLESSFSSVSSPANTTHQGYSVSSPSRPLPTPQRTPVQTSFLAPPAYNSGAGDACNTETEMAMRRAILEQQRHPHQEQQHRRTNQQQGEDEATFPYSLAQSVSSLSHNSPATPQTSYPDDFDESNKSLSHGETNLPDIDRWMDEYLQADAFADLGSQSSSQIGMPKLNRTISDVYQDELYNPLMAAPQQETKPVQPRVNKPYAPYLNVMADRLQAAQQGHISARSHSPNSNIARQRSPFRHGSPYAQMPSAYTSAHLQQPTHPTSGLRGMELMGTGSAAQDEPKTISPKDALLEYHEPEEGNVPLFPSQTDSSQYNVPTTMTTSPEFQLSANFTPLSQYPNQFGQGGDQNGQFYLPQPQQHPQMPRQPQQGTMRSHQPQQQQPDRTLIQHTPEFPAHVPSMESTNSERNNSGVSSTPTRPQPQSPIKRPLDTSSDAGTYSCTYHGCTLRFETPAKLQKHKREAHRQTTPGSHGLARDGSSLAMRNSQAGPHKCERINPSTGKPCNSIFSRPYDLTRHEDTIHNARKQKVRCHLCTEEKTFSRNDALTRHMRVVHPDVNWPGKQRRRGRE
ncbi:C2H2 type zinc finger containing protein [Coccidioides posadasii C735 delta SOWgp]|uniref:C2H2 type zinc finger containing protein n=1 Tax=Coccidioides posadasii (strain C735) TaxID=222929 RepID=C5PA92_COCP7|nr:C2H2 type zinc finger containing protein [Coccidioides posadasii C735 delta SOWgp]EER26654.1 C2H2 type zinc finger containing protein [Coccidioides posadasii C735 delta SOWgp]|eukprot:XP_003068799.1 C2H2 type zinc finger containing protein [Coccidioides posadasii C735 delta SOWgp]